jgi:hypothetical protein
VIAVLTVLIVALGVNAYLIQTGRLDKQEDKTAAAVVGGKHVADAGQSLADEVLAACAAGGKQTKALSEAGLCGKASTTKKDISDTVKDVPAVPAGSTTTIVRRETVPTGTIVAIVNSALRDAVVASCGTDGCRDGKNGADSQVPGPASTVPGPASTVPGPEGDTGPKGEKGDTPSDETVIALIRRVLAENPPTNGVDGRGITSLACSATLGPITFTVTYTDGTTQQFSCGDAPIDPDPEPVEPKPAP